MLQTEPTVLPPLQHSAALCPCLPQLCYFPVNFLCIIPSSIGVYLDLSVCNGIKIGYFYHLYCAYDWPTIANVDPSCSSACIAALKSWGFYARTHAYVVGLRPSRN